MIDSLFENWIIFPTVREGLGRPLSSRATWGLDRQVVGILNPPGEKKQMTRSFFFLGGGGGARWIQKSYSASVFLIAKHSSSFYIPLDLCIDKSMDQWFRNKNNIDIQTFQKKQNMLRLTLWRGSFLQQNPWYPRAPAMWLMTRTKTIAANKFTKNDRRNWIHASKKWHFLGGAKIPTPLAGGGREKM